MLINHSHTNKPFLEKYWGRLLFVIVLVIIIVNDGITALYSYPIPTQKNVYIPPKYHLLGLILPIATSIYFTYKAFKIYKKRRPQQNSCDGQVRANVKGLASIMLLIWSLGWIGYYLAIYVDYNRIHSLSELLLYSATCSLNMFMLDLNGNVLDSCSNVAIRGFVILVGVCAAISTVSIVLTLFLSRLSSYRHMRRLTKKNYEEVFVFFGVNSPSLTLAQSIHKKYENNQKDYLVVFVEEKKLDDGESDGWSTIKNMFTHNGVIMSSVKNDEHTALVVADKPVSEISDEISIWDQLNLSESLGVILKKGVLHNYFFFLSDDRESNVISTINLANNLNTNIDIDNYHPHTTIYCHTRNDSLSRNLENALPNRIKNAHPDIEVNVIDDSQLALDWLKKDLENHPVKFVEIDQVNPGTVSTPFTSLVLGFGETGQDTVRYLYEFGAFVDSRSTEAHTFRSPFFCHIVDANMDNLIGRFKAEAPNIDCFANINDNEGIPLLTYYNFDCRSQAFYELLQSLAPTLNYVVIAIGDGDTNMEMAINMLNIVRRYRKDLNKFRIYVRVYDTTKRSKLDEISTYYNAFNDSCVIKMFGFDIDLFDYDLIINDEKIKMAAEYDASYSYIGESIPKWKKMEVWSRRHMIARGREGSSWDRICRAQIVEAHGYSLVDHGKTQMYIIDTVTDCGVEPFAHKLFSMSFDSDRYYRYGEGFNISYANLESSPKEQSLMNNLAKLEHLRWYACEELHGFVWGIRSSYIYKTHHCLTHWEEIGSDNMIFSYVPVETSLSMSIGVKPPRLKY